MRLIESFVPNPDAVETHKIEITASRAVVYQTLWTADLGGSLVIKGLMTLRSLPQLVLHRGRRQHPQQKVTLHTLIEAGFGRLAEEPGREIVLGVAGRFWRLTGNILPFSQENFHGPVPPGLARAVWNFTVEEGSAGRTLLSTETRVVCRDTASRVKFRAYWLIVRPFSGLIRLSTLRAVRRACEGTPLHVSADTNRN
ncbi:MAG: hypothetical protein HY268_24540 [Deltaproteobacteria bacterium]|nr:hypothetical protein [Deltaproteobacteria bacterium]